MANAVNLKAMYPPLARKSQAKASLTMAEQKRALKFLTDIVKEADESNPGETGYCDHEDTMELRVFLIKVGALPDRRKKR